MTFDSLSSVVGVSSSKKDIGAHAFTRHARMSLRIVTVSHQGLYCAFVICTLSRLESERLFKIFQCPYYWRINYANIYQKCVCISVLGGLFVRPIVHSVRDSIISKRTKCSISAYQYCRT